jgi:SAM-dependent methyltransferase
MAVSLLPDNSDMASASYNPKDYWLEQGKVYKNNFKYNNKFELQERMLLEYLTSNIFTSNSEGRPVELSVLEVGCGFGRITRLLLESFGKAIVKYVAVDMSPDQIRNARDYVEQSYLKGGGGTAVDDVDGRKGDWLEFVVSDIQSLKSTSASNHSYDLVLASEVLLHILPSEIQKVVYQLTEMSNRHIINVDWYEDEVPKKVAPHNFIHRYEEIYSRIPTVKRVRRIPILKKGVLSKLDTKQSIFHASKQAD